MGFDRVNWRVQRLLAFDQLLLNTHQLIVQFNQITFKKSIPLMKSLFKFGLTFQLPHPLFKSGIIVYKVNNNRLLVELDGNVFERMLLSELELGEFALLKSVLLNFASDLLFLTQQLIVYLF